MRGCWTSLVFKSIGAAASHTRLPLARQLALAPVTSSLLAVHSAALSMRAVAASQQARCLLAAHQHCSPYALAP